jgi:hypothetical protein
MRLQRRKYFVAVLACSLLTLAAVGCGDDEDDAPAGDGGAGEGGSGGKSGAGGGGGTGGASGAPSAAMCTTETTKVGVKAECAACVCEKATRAANACLAETACWQLINCVGTMCPATPINCPVCRGMYMDGLAAATALVPALTNMCEVECAIEVPDDAGADDAGF